MLICLGSAEFVSTNPKPTSVPILFRPEGVLLVSGRNYLVPIILEKDSLLLLTAPVKTALATIAALYDQVTTDSRNITKSRGRDSNDKFATSNLIPQSIHSHLELLLKDVENRENEIRSFLRALGEEVPVRRKPRGLLNAVGELSRYLFGTSTEKEQLETRKLVEQLESLTEEERK